MVAIERHRGESFDAARPSSNLCVAMRLRSVRDLD